MAADRSAVAERPAERQEKVRGRLEKVQLWVYFGNEWRCAGFFETAEDAEAEVEKNWRGFRKQHELVTVTTLG